MRRADASLVIWWWWRRRWTQWPHSTHLRWWRRRWPGINRLHAAPKSGRRRRRWRSPRRPRPHTNWRRHICGRQSSHDGQDGEKLEEQPHLGRKRKRKWTLLLLQWWCELIQKIWGGWQICIYLGNLGARGFVIRGRTWLVCQCNQRLSSVDVQRFLPDNTSRKISVKESTWNSSISTRAGKNSHGSKGTKKFISSHCWLKIG